MFSKFYIEAKLENVRCDWGNVDNAVELKTFYLLKIFFTVNIRFYFIHGQKRK